ncbi:tyrosine-protein phosphatase non-receptor type substrate 1-like [Erythrolamprus reginae]|uniref:tyrosine-protein phosphatase non-receptor type substrate 1-like n=1 Tax=Erythrolamprus reginae TaxID=121349 RepID=UPI00396CF4E3
MASGTFISGLFFLVLSSLSSARTRGIEDKDPRLSQPQTSVSVGIGDVLHLECEVHSTLHPGAVKWFLGEGPQRKLIYADTKIDEINERITRNSRGCNTDFSISIHNVTLEDMGIYYCVKEKKELGRSMDWLKGPGTRVVVTGSQGWSIYSLYLGLFLNKVAMALLLFGLFQMKQHRGCLARYCAKSKPPPPGMEPAETQLVFDLAQAEPQHRLRQDRNGIAAWCFNQ